MIIVMLIERLGHGDVHNRIILLHRIFIIVVVVVVMVVVVVFVVVSEWHG